MISLRVGLVAGLLWSSSLVASRAADDPPAPAVAESLSPAEWAKLAEQRFKPFDEAAVDASRRQVLATIDALEPVLDNQPEGGVVRRTTNLARLKELLAPGKAELEPLREIYRQMARSQPEACQAAVDATRKALLSLLGKLEWRAIADQRAAYLQAVQQVAAGLAAASHDRASWETLNRAFGQLAKTGLVDDLLAPVREQKSHPNQFIVIRREFVQAMVERDIRSSQPIQQNSGGATIRGRADFTGKPTVALAPNDERGEFRVLVDGAGTIPITATKHPATMRSLSRATFHGEQVLYVVPAGVEIGAQQVCVRNRTSLQGLCLHFRSRLVKAMLTPIAKRVAVKKLPEADRELETKARAEISQQLTENSYLLMYQVNGLLNRVLWQTIDARDVDPQIHPFTTPDQFNWVAHVVTPTTLGSPTAPPEYAVAMPPLQMQLHESASNNSDSVMAGRRFNEVLFHELVFGSLRLKPEDDVLTNGGRIPAAFTFATEQPLEIRFDDNRITIVVRFSAFELDGKQYDGPTRTATMIYQPRLEPDRIALERQGEIQLAPAEAGDEAACRRTLERFFVRRASTGRAFSANVPGLEIYVSHFLLRDGWLQLGAIGRPTTP